MARYEVRGLKAGRVVSVWTDNPKAATRLKALNVQTGWAVRVVDHAGHPTFEEA